MIVFQSEATPFTAHSSRVVGLQLNRNSNSYSKRALHQSRSLVAFMNGDLIWLDVHSDDSPTHPNDSSQKWTEGYGRASSWKRRRVHLHFMKRIIPAWIQLCAALKQHITKSRLFESVMKGHHKLASTYCGTHKLKCRMRSAVTVWPYDRVYKHWKRFLYIGIHARRK